MIRAIRLFAPLLACAAQLAASDAVSTPPAALRIDAARTRVGFTLSSVLHTVHGTFRLTRGDLRFDPSTGSASGELVVDAASGDTGNGTRDGRMHNHVLESAKYPEIVFRPDRVEGTVAPEGASEVRLHGAFTIHGSAHELSVPLSVRASGGQYAATARFEVPYVAWGMKNPSTLFLRVSDKVDLTVETVALPAH
jgi:polyisoprenoid-binding protein YceI